MYQEAKPSEKTSSEVFYTGRIALVAKFSGIGTQCTKNKRDELTLDNAFLTTSSPGANALAAQLHKQVGNGNLYLNLRAEAALPAEAFDAAHVQLSTMRTDRFLIFFHLSCLFFIFIFDQ